MTSHQEGQPGLTDAALVHAHKAAREGARVVHGVIELALAPIFIGVLNRQIQQPESEGHGSGH